WQLQVLTAPTRGAPLRRATAAEPRLLRPSPPAPVSRAERSRAARRRSRAVNRLAAAVPGRRRSRSRRPRSTTRWGSASPSVPPGCGTPRRAWTVTLPRPHAVPHPPAGPHSRPPVPPPPRRVERTGRLAVVLRGRRRSAAEPWAEKRRRGLEPAHRWRGGPMLLSRPFVGAVRTASCNLLRVPPR